MNKVNDRTRLPVVVFFFLSQNDYGKENNRMTSLTSLFFGAFLHFLNYNVRNLGMRKVAHIIQAIIN